MQSKIPDGSDVRPATLDDLKSVLHLIATQNIADYDEPMISVDTLRQAWQSPNFNLTTNTWLVTASDGHLAGYAELRYRAPTQFSPAVYVAVEYRGQGIGTHLLQLAEARAVASSADKTPIELTCRVSERDAAGKHILEKAGYTLKLSFSLMEIVMTEPPALPQWAEGITVRTFIVGQDEQATYAADEQASEDKGYHKPLTFEAWATRMSLHGDSFDPTLWFLACDGNKVAGVALNFYSQETDTGWVDHLGVRREWRNKGIGMALLLYSFGVFFRRGTQRVKLSVDSHSLTNAPRLYECAGMHAVQQYHIYKKEGEGR